MIRLIASDMDGTLFRSNQEISPLNLAALQQAARQNVAFMIATGRSMETIGPIADKYHLHCHFLLMNGAEVRDPDRNVICTTDIDTDLIPKLSGVLREMGYNPEYMTDAGSQICCSLEELELNMGYRMLCLDRNHTMTLEQAIAKGRESVFMQFMTRNDTLEDMLQKKVSVRKMIVFGRDLEQNRKNRETLQNMFPELSVLSSYPDNIEINARDAQKGYGLLKAIERLGITKEETAVFGDGLNDLSMFECFSNSFAPQNAEYEIKKRALEVIPSNDEDGVGKKIFELLYQNKEKEANRI